MVQVKLTIDGQGIEVPAKTTILEAAGQGEIYIPTLCHHPGLPPAQVNQTAKEVYQGDHRIRNAVPEKSGDGCNLCVVEIEGEKDPTCACSTEVKDGMVVFTDNKRIRKRRRENLIPILVGHPHACLTCAQREGCSRAQCSTNVPGVERCCTRFGHCELQEVAAYIGISDATSKWIPTNLPILKEDRFYKRDYNLCIGCTRCVRACRDLKGIEALGAVYDENLQVRVGTLEKTLEDSGCKYCTACVEVCPTGALMDKAVRLKREEATLHYPSPPKKWWPFDMESIAQTPETEGVYRLLDEERYVLVIKGTPNLRGALEQELEENAKAVWFEIEKDKMYTKRESELIQHYLQEHGEMPGGGDSDLDDLY